MTSSNGNIFFDVFFDLRLNKRLSKQPLRRWFETPAWSLWRHRNAIMVCLELASDETTYGTGRQCHYLWNSNMAAWLSTEIYSLRERLYNDVTVSTMASQIFGIVTVLSTVCSGTDKKHQSSVHWPLWGKSTGGFHSQWDSNAENISVWWPHHFGQKPLVILKITLICWINARPKLGMIVEKQREKRIRTLSIQAVKMRITARLKLGISAEKNEEKKGIKTSNIQVVFSL